MLVAAVAVLAATALGASAATRDARQQLHGTQPAWTAAAPPTATVPGSQQESAKVWLASRSASQLAALAAAVSDPSSPQYRQYLTHAQYVSRFAPSASQLQAVRSWLSGAGLKTGTVGPDSHYVTVSGTAAAMQAAFGAQLGLYDVNGEQAQAPTSDFSVPSSVAGSVLAVTGLTTFGHTVSTQDLGAPAAFVNAGPCSTYYGEKVATDLPKFQGSPIPYAVCGYVPRQLRDVYGITGTGLTGAGQTVAITDAFDASTLLQDANTYATAHGDPAFTAGQFSDRSVPEDTTLAADCGGNGWYGEQTLDVEAVHAMAPGAGVAYYGAASCYDDDLLAALAQVAYDDQASIVTNSWGEPTFVRISGHLYATIDSGTIGAYESVFQEGAVEGIGFCFSSGDSGDELASWGFKSPDWPTGDPWVTSVGGTSLAVGQSGQRLFETGWGTGKYVLTPKGTSWTEVANFLYGAGGGYSDVFARPWWQDALVTGHQGRAVPDVSLDADPTTGMLVGETQDFGAGGIHYGEYRIGGTSLASPLMAGVQALVQQARNTRLGFADPMLYALAQSTPGSFYDTTPQGDAGNVRMDYVNGLDASAGVVASVRTFNADSTLNTRVGWDDVTGLGSITGRYFDAAGLGGR